MKMKTMFILLIVVIFTSGVAVAVQNQGSKDIKLNGGYKGIVNFPHYLHQDVINNCDVCHAVFPKTTGAIKKLEADGKLGKKQVMNKTCIKCHKGKKKEGKKTGPTKCSQCHTK